jgi:hypothetical protein
VATKPAQNHPISPQSGRSLVHNALTKSALLAAALVIGATAGMLSGLGGQQLYVIGLYEVAAGAVGAYVLVALAHASASRQQGVHLALAAAFALSWLAADVVVDAALSRQQWITDVADAGLMLADSAVLRGDDDPAGLVDESLLADTGAKGWRGATRLRIKRGFVVVRAGAMTRVVTTPPWLHVLLMGLRAGIVALIVARALAHLRAEPLCAQCGRAMQRRQVGRIDRSAADALAAHWKTGDRTAPLRSEDDVAAGPFIVLEDRCPAGCTQLPGWELRRLRGRGLGRATPGVFAALPATVHGLAADATPQAR